MRRRRFALSIVAPLVIAACGSLPPSATPQVSPAPTAAPSPTDAPASAPPTPSPTPGPTGPYASQPYALDLPDGWQSYDLSNPGGSAALDAFIAANPSMAAAVQAFMALPNVVMAINPLLGNVVVTLALPSGGLSLDAIAAGFTAQFSAVPGLVSVPEAELIDLPVGPAVHWDLVLEANDPGGGTHQVAESVYLVANDTAAVLVEFVSLAAAGSPQEAQMIQTLRFTP